MIEQRVALWRTNRRLPWVGAALLVVSVVLLLALAFDGGRGIDGAPFDGLEWRDIRLVVALAAPGPVLAAGPLAARPAWLQAVGYAMLALAAMFAGFIGGIAAFFTGLCLDSPPDPCGLPPSARLVVIATAVGSLVPGAILHAYLRRRFSAAQSGATSGG